MSSYIREIFGGMFGADFQTKVSLNFFAFYLMYKPIKLNNLVDDKLVENFIYYTHIALSNLFSIRMISYIVDRSTIFAIAEIRRET